MKAKEYPVSLVAGQPNFDSLPVAKITDYPLEQRNYKPFAQAILCVSTQELFLRMWAFEVSPAKGSALACVLYPFADKPGQGFCLRIWHEGDHALGGFSLLGASGSERPAPQSHAHNGEDLQGVYWGMTLALPLAAIEELGGPVSLAPGNVVLGNFYKTCAGAQTPHMGSYFRADFLHAPYARASMGDFRVVGY